jgi:hypothetical protein
MDALLKAFEQRGYSIQVTAPRREQVEDRYGRGKKTVKHPSSTSVTIDGESFAFGLEEEAQYVHPPMPRPASDDFAGYLKWRRTPLPPKLATGVMVLAIKDAYGGRKRWTDGKPKSLESCLDDFVRALRRATEIRKAARRQREEEARRDEEESTRQEQERRRRARIEAERRREERRVANLSRDVERWQRASALRAYVAEARALLAARGKEGSLELDGYFAWALARADRLDPLPSLIAQGPGVRRRPSQSVRGQNDALSAS